MSEPIGLASGLADLAMFAFQASVALYMTVKSYNSHLNHVGDFAEKTSVLSEVLGLLTETLSAPRNNKISLRLRFVCDNAVRPAKSLNKKSRNFHSGRAAAVQVFETGPG
jgi:hypothetical protein